MSANYQSRAEAEASLMLGHDKAAAHHAEELRGAAACVKQWSEKLKP